MKQENLKFLIGTADSSFCTPHDPGSSCEPACTGGGHCVSNILSSRRPTRMDMLEWLSLKSNAKQNQLYS